MIDDVCTGNDNDPIPECLKGLEEYYRSYPENDRRLLIGYTDYPLEIFSPNHPCVVNGKVREKE